MEMKNRRHIMDNGRALLICCVVIGHLMEIVKLPQGKYIYLIIYSFHMPAFAFLSGCCYKGYDAGRIVKAYIYPYVIFQSLYLLFDRYVLGGSAVWQYSRPYWIMWYLLAMAGWNMVTSFFYTQTPWKKVIGFLTALFLALLAGYDNNIGYVLSLSRMVVFFPFYLTGVYLKNNIDFFLQWRSKPGFSNRVVTGTSLFLAGAVIYILYWKQNSIMKKWLYQSYSYEKGGYDLGIRLLCLCGAFILLMLLCLVIPNRKIKFFTCLGQNTMPIFLLHGFLIKWLQSTSFMVKDKYPWLFMTGAFLLIIGILSRKVVARVCAPLMKWQW